jgi:hypothetical protein
MCWTDRHLHEFEKDGKAWGVLRRDEFDEFDLTDEGKTQLANVLKSEGDSMVYEYDFGDDWRHEIVLENILPAGSTATRPVCLAGERRCPPEDVGGVHGYQEFLEVIFDQEHEEYEQMVRWAVGYCEDGVDMIAGNHTISQIHWPVRHRR